MDVFNRLKRLKNEDLIWIIYFFIITFAIISNVLEKDYILTNDKIAYKKSKTINIILFLVTFFIYLYFVLLFTKDLNNMERNFNNQNYRNTFLQLIAALLFLIGGSIYLFQAIFDKDIEEIGFIWKNDNFCAVQV